jgi:hypothetical protein
VRGSLLAAVFIGLLGEAHAQPAPPPDIFPGNTAETAIVLPGTADEFHGVAAEHAYIAAHFPDWHIESQALVDQNGRHYDLIGMVKPDRTKVTVYFDVTDWLGK